jgi:hypothetical protein
MLGSGRPLRPPEGKSGVRMQGRQGWETRLGWTVKNYWDIYFECSPSELTPALGELTVCHKAKAH